MRLQNPVGGATLSTTSDQEGGFVFDAVPNGVYVLHIEGGESGRGYDPTDLLARLTDTASRTILVLARQEDGRRYLTASPLALNPAPYAASCSAACGVPIDATRMDLAIPRAFSSLICSQEGSNSYHASP